MENTATITFYRNMALGAGLFHGLLLITLYSDSLTTLTIVSICAYLYNIFDIYLIRSSHTSVHTSYSV